METESRMVVAGAGGEGEDEGLLLHGEEVSVWGREKSSGGGWRWLSNSVSVLNDTDLHTEKWLK